MGFSVVVLESDSRLAQSLAGGLSSHFKSVHLTRSRDELRERIARNRPEAVILDMESSRLTDVRNLHRDFPSLPIVCTHRVPDEELWIAALEAGASDVCPADDVPKVLSSVLRNVAIAHHAAA
jgi:DNA-binding response OmpR family regulator